MTSLWLSLIIAILILYKLYSVIGFDEGDSAERLKAKNDPTPETPNPQNENIEQPVKRDIDSEIEIYKNLDLESQQNLEKIYEKYHNFNFSWFFKHCDFLCSTLFKALSENNIEIVREYCNRAVLDKLNPLLKNKKTLVKINEIKVLNVRINNDNMAIILVKFIVDDMLTADKNFYSKKEEFTLSISKTLDELDSNWIITDINFNI